MFKGSGENSSESFNMVLPVFLNAMKEKDEARKN